jgi:glycerol kinase
LLRVDGGMVENNWFIQNLSNICNYQIQKAFTKESTALGAALISGLGAGYYSGLDDLRNLSIKRDQASPDMDVILRRNIILNWDKAIKLTIDMTK